MIPSRTASPPKSTKRPTTPTQPACPNPGHADSSHHPAPPNSKPYATTHRNRSRQYTFGHAAHKLILGKGADILEVDAPNWKTKAAQEQRALASNSVAPMLTHELAQARAMVDAVKAHPYAGPLFDEGHAELSMYHTDRATGVRLRGRLDWLRLLDDRHVIIDFKTSVTAEPAEFVRKGTNFGYHMQYAWYTDLVKAAIPGSDPRFLFVVVEKDPPHLVSVIELDDEALAEGRRLNRDAINTYAECIATDTWPSYPNNDQVQLISLPYWAIQDEMEIA